MMIGLFTVTRHGYLAQQIVQMFITIKKTSAVASST